MKKNFMKFAAGRLVFAIVLICTMVPTVAIAQGNVDELLKQAEQAAKKADKKPADGKLQLAAARSFVRIELGEKKDIDRALVYANRALKIAESQTVMQDTLKGFSYLLLGGLFFEKRDFNKSFECYENGLEALGKELGRYDCFTIYEKLYFGQFIMLNVDIRRGSLIIQQAFLDSEMIPEEKRIKNILELNSLYEFAVENLMADMSNKMQRCLPLITYENKKYLVLETDAWDMTQSIIGWLEPGILDMLQGHRKNDKSHLILCDINDTSAPLRNLEFEGDKGPVFTLQFSLNPADHSLLNIPEETTRLLFFNEDIFKQILDRYNAFKESQDKK